MAAAPIRSPAMNESNRYISRAVDDQQQPAAWFIIFDGQANSWRGFRRESMDFDGSFIEGFHKGSALARAKVRGVLA